MNDQRKKCTASRTTQRAHSVDVAAHAGSAGLMSVGVSPQWARAIGHIHDLPEGAC